ncbi:radical SAM family heme chaperone HemW [Rhodobacter sp. 24-YEA-8]|uniref:radical SAM family heme chaperone HemW n=1 Tax=Rhodobacter sp. 24-YEA-8 TaxID=1884310 RepID=UPI000899C3FF|nr:radical SAM family heme chaperone HemW [Rhodobacter sp. 24-YEA-8]SEC66487.1 oxygen-independent coproporphyrinogen-3 oxidase [Rhodobacter sp. 24-YEA-8]
MKQEHAEDWKEGGFSLYLHWPFCKAKCPYCDFNSHVRARIDQAEWKKAYLKELDRAAAETGGRILHSVFFGGGTPSLMDPDTVGAILDRVSRHWRMTNDFEVTLEANPTSVEASRFAAYRLAGVNRVSLGLQALNDQDLRRLGRQHSAAEGLAALDLARSLFDRTSCDLIYARQDQDLASWGDELRHVLARGPDHISLYQLTVEEGTVFARLYDAGKLRGLPDEDLAADMYDLTTEICGEAGLSGYEVSNYARPGSESRHNLTYWRMGDYLGIGPGAHGRLTLNGQRVATLAHKSPELWLEFLRKTGKGEVPRETISTQDQALEYLMMSLRLSEGMSFPRYIRMLGRQPRAEVLETLQQDGFITLQDDRLTATATGRLLLNRLILELSEA